MSEDYASNVKHYLSRFENMRCCELNGLFHKLRRLVTGPRLISTSQNVSQLTLPDYFASPRSENEV